MSALSDNLLLGAPAAAAGGISRSLRFNSSDSAYCSRGFSTPTDQKKWTWAGWIKRGRTLSGAWDYVFVGNNQGDFGFYSDKFYFYDIFTASNLRLSTPVFRDLSAWYHLLVAYDSANATVANRLRVYINGVEITAWDTNASITLNATVSINGAVTHTIGGAVGYAYFSGYLAYIHFIDGQALTPSSFGQTDANGIWQPKAYTGTYGTNGFRLPFSDNSTAAALGTDTSGNNNTWSVSNISVAAGAGNDSLVDSPTNITTDTDTGAGGEVRGNYATLNPLNNGGVTLTNGNLDWSRTAAGTRVSYGTIGVSSGKWYFESVINGATSGVNWECGIATVGTSNATRPGTLATGWQVGTSGTSTIFKVSNNSYTNIYTSGLSNGDILGVAFDIDNGRIWFARNGTWLEGSPSAGTGASFTNVSGTVAPFAGADGSGPNGSLNFGQRPFAYTAPSGFKALCTTNLDTPTGVVAQPSTAMDVKLYTGNGSTQTVSGLNMSPDLVWIKNRSEGFSNILTDTVRGTGNKLISDRTDAENTTDADPKYGTLEAFTSSGFTVNVGTFAGTAGGQLNKTNIPYVAWCFDAGSSTVTNNSGSISSQVRANASAGFSIVSYVSNGTNGTSVGHGLNVKPALVIQKDRTSASDWLVLTQLIDGSNDYLLLNSTAAAATAAAGMTSTTFGSWDRTNGNNMIAYCFAPVAGYSSFGSYTGNGSSDGPFVYTGFRPRWLMVKLASAAGENWVIIDSARSDANIADDILWANLSNAELANYGSGFDFTANGFKIRGAWSGNNTSAGTYIYAAFSEACFQFARAR